MLSREHWMQRHRESSAPEEYVPIELIIENLPIVSQEHAHATKELFELYIQLANNHFSKMILNFFKRELETEIYNHGRHISV